MPSQPTGRTPSLGELLQRGRSAWPGVDLAAPDFERHLAPRLGGEGAPGELCVEDLYLACACALGDPAAVAAFERHFLSRVSLFLSRMRPEPSLVDEVKQALRVRLLVAPAGSPPKIAEYSGRGSLQSWLQVAAVRAAIDLRRQRGGPEAEGAEREGAAEAVAGGRDPELDYLKGRYRAEFEGAFGASLQALPSEQRNVLRLHLVDGLSVDQIGGLFRVHRSTAARWVASAREAVLKETRGLLRARLGVSASEIESLARLIESQFDLSVARLLGDAPEGRRRRPSARERLEAAAPAAPATRARR
ncbi:MAG TPA: sigma factor-like helix-turn-helix DNA-binding protein [Polyangiaceae bacterium]|nr:sigma factor-like helix-turn-helix DNA-binding protein [Polyangiaceae bacterium]